jgi:glycosyltransferase involved in cell wall biosynthesis
VKVLFVTTNWPRPDLPIDGIFVREHARAAALSADVRVLHLERSVGRTGLAETESVAGEEPPTLRIRYRRFGKPVSLAAFVGGPLAAYRRLRREGFEPDVLHANSHLSALPALALGRLYRKPVVYSEHWSAFLPDNPAELAGGMRALARIALRGADVVLPVSEAMRRALEAAGSPKGTVVVPNVVDERLFRPGGEREPGLLLTAGMLGENQAKGVDYLLRAVALVDGVRLDVVGEGPLRADYERLARELEIDERVQFHGFLPKPELAERMRRAELFVLASRFENNPCVVLEAMASGLPVVATRVGGLPELVDETSGILAEPGDPESIAARIGEALDRSFDRAAIARRATERYGREAVGAALSAVYEEVVARKTSPRQRAAAR